MGGHKMSKSLYLPFRISKVYIKAFTRFSHKHCPDGLCNTLLSQGCVLEAASSEGKAVRIHIPRTAESSVGRGPAHMSTDCQILSVTSSNSCQELKSQAPDWGKYAPYEVYLMQDFSPEYIFLNHRT